MLISGLIILKINLQFGKFYIRSLNCQVLLNRTEISPNIRSKYFLKYSGYILDIFWIYSGENCLELVDILFNKT